MEVKGQDNYDLTSVRAGNLSRSRGKGPGLRMLPMIDVIFLLLAFFVLTAKFRLPEESLALRLPDGVRESNSFTIIEPLGLEIAATEAGFEVMIGGVEAVVIGENAIEEGIADFAEKFKEVAASQKRYAGDPVEIRCSNEVKWDHLVKIYNMLQAMGMSDITFHMNE